jgi:hypothetical protein
MQEDLVRASRLRRTAGEIAELLADYRQSGQGQREFCQQRGIGLSTLQNYLRGGRSGRKAQGLVEVELVAGNRVDAKARSLELTTTNGYRISVGRGFEAGDLIRLVKTIEQIGGIGR